MVVRSILRSNCWRLAISDNNLCHSIRRKDVIDSMLQAMSIAALFDLHWEVKTNALSFWDNFVKSHLSDQGMLDNSFPKVTFSKEHRKIVALDESEIKRRLNKALDELARQSCLSVSKYEDLKNSMLFNSVCISISN